MSRTRTYISRLNTNALKVLVLGTVAAFVAGVSANAASAATGLPTTNTFLPYVICDYTNSPRTFYVQPPIATAVDATNGADTSIIRYWIRFVDRDSGVSVVTPEYTYGGQATATEQTPAPLPYNYYSVGSINIPYYVWWQTGILNHVQVQYTIQWYRPSDMRLQYTVIWTKNSSTSYRVRDWVNDPYVGHVRSWTGWQSSCGPYAGL
jgi:hypothetical protein